MIPLSDPRSWDHPLPQRPAPECLDYAVTCVRCGCWIEAGEDVGVRGGETECWGECGGPTDMTTTAATLEDE